MINASLFSCYIFSICGGFPLDFPHQIWYNIQMERKSQSIHTIVVETYDYDKDHVFICGREPDKKVWHHFMASHTSSHPCFVRFSDRLIFQIDKFKLELDRGPLLKYNTPLDDFPTDLMEEIMATTPYRAFPDHELHFWGLRPE